jgi:hypothetical protein
VAPSGAIEYGGLAPALAALSDEEDGLGGAGEGTAEASGATGYGVGSLTGEAPATAAGGLAGDGGGSFGGEPMALRISITPVTATVPAGGGAASPASAEAPPELETAGLGGGSAA